MEQIAADHSSDWQGLGVGILHRLIMEDRLGYTDLPKPEYVHLVRSWSSGGWPDRQTSSNWPPW